MLLVAAASSGWVLWHTRDRTPGYALDQRVRPGTDVTDPPLAVGFGRATITPDLSRTVWLAGFANGRRATAVHDDLWATAIVIDDGAHRVALAALDAIGLFHDDVVAIRAKVAPRAAIDYVIVASTHNHSTPDLMGLWGPRAGFTGVDPAYRAHVIDATVDAIVAAFTARTPARVGFAEVPLSPAGLVADSRDPQVFDATLRLMHVTDPADGHTLGSIVNWADHPETPWADNTEVTADFPGYLRDALEHGVVMDGRTALPALGGVHLYVNGAIGGLMTTNPGTTVEDPFTSERYTAPSHDKARAVGRRLADAVVTLVKDGGETVEARPTLSVTARTLELALDNPLFRLASAAGTIDRGQPHWNRLRTEIAVVTVGASTWLCVPGELYPEIANGGITHPDGADFDVAPVEVPPLRSLMPGRVKFLIGLANDEVGYIIPKSEWDDRAPWLYGAAERHYGEINSLGPDTAPALHEAIKTLLADAGH